LEPRRLKIGQKIQVPPPPPATGTSGGTVGGTEPGAGGETLKVHVVQKGDTLSKIAHANGVTPKDLRAVNKLKTDRINVGQKIKIPPAKPSPAGTTAAAGTAAGR
jgi:N-acetylmuramoyl-L-alanine amidase